MRERLSILHLALFLSGAAALVYQIAWGRMLQRVFGVGDLAVATVLGSFFLGLGLGAALGGRWGRTVRRPALAYALLEAGVAVWALASLLLIPNVHDVYGGLGRGASFATLTTVRLLLSLVVLVPPTILMGATLPVLIGVVARSRRTWGSPATALYAVNTFGAMVGAGATGLWLMPAVGTRASILIAAAASVAAGGVVAAAWWKPAASPAAPEAPAEAEPSAGPARYALLALGLAAMAGFAALASEVLWTRVLRMIVQGTTPAFAAMLVNYLFGIAVGSLIVDRILRRGHSALRLFAWSQVILAALTLLSMAMTPHLPRLLGLLRGDATLEPHRTWVVLVLASVLLLPLALVIGTSIPLAWRIAAVPRERAPTHAGRVLAANTLGGLVGSLAAGFLMVPALGIERSIGVILLVHLGASVVAFFRQHDASLRARLLGMAAPTAVALIALFARPSLELAFLLDARNDPHKAIIEGPSAEWPRRLVFLREGRNTTVTVVRAGDGTLRLYNDGRPESGFGQDPPGFGAELAMLGVLPTLFAEERRGAFVIGLGAGHTATMLLAGPWERIDVIELEEAVVEAARVLHREHGAPFPLDDERAHLIVDDARAQLVLAAPGSYDAIVSQPSHPWLAGSSALYTREFFEEAARALDGGGVVALWVNLFRADVDTLRSVTATLLSVFPHGHAFVVESSSFILVASESPIPLDGRVGERVDTRALASYLEPHRLDHLIDLAVMRELDGPALARFAQGAPILTDDRPALEFRLAAIPADATVARSEIDRAVADVPWLAAESFGVLPPDVRADVLVERAVEVTTRPAGIDRVEGSLGALPLGASERAWVEGAIAEARGEVDRALERFDASEEPRAAYAADRLRLAERRHREALEAARARAARPAIARALLSHAAALGDPEAIAFAVERWRETDDDADRDLALSLLAHLEQGCGGLLAHPALPAEAREDEHLALLAERCAAVTGDLAALDRYAELRHQTRRATAVRAAERGQSAFEEGNLGGAERLLRRSLRASPTHGGAAATLARLLSGTGRRDEAKEVLESAYRAAEGLPRATDAVEEAAAELGFVLRKDPS